jgi:serine/threonine protein kinase
VAEPRTGDRIGDFTVGSRIGGGGNADVFEAAGGHCTVALKVLRTRRVESEPYQRFRREIDVLRSIGAQPGVLPLLDFHLPDSLEKGERTWLAMPIAERIDDALREEELTTIVSAVAAIARTLAALQRDHGLAHRDLKPQNLYRYDGEFVVGDFGLVALPDAQALTAPGRLVGPANFVAWEMMAKALDVDPAPADVYSLAKTLWVLAAGSAWPPPGHQPAGTNQGVGAYRPHARASELDELIDRATRLEPSRRPTMDGVATDLAAWLQTPPGTPEMTELLTVAAELRRRAMPHIEASDASEEESRAVYALSERIHDGLATVTEAIRNAFPQVGDPNTSYLVQMLQSGESGGFGQPAVRIRYLAGAGVHEYAEISAHRLEYGVLLEHIDDGTVRVVAGISLTQDGVFGEENWIGERRNATVESLASERIADDAVAELAKGLPAWLRRFNDRIE